MKIVSDLTKDTRPTLREILIESIRDTVIMDKDRRIEDGELVRRENETFYYRSVILFTQRALLYYTDEEVEVWSRKKLLDEPILPKIDGLKIGD